MESFTLEEVSWLCGGDRELTSVVLSLWKCEIGEAEEEGKERDSDRQLRSHELK